MTGINDLVDVLADDAFTGGKDPSQSIQNND